MIRSFHQFACDDDMLAGVLDEGHETTGLLIVSGGNEIKSGAHAGMAKLAHLIARNGFPVFRYDRRGIGDSSGSNRGFQDSQADIIAATEYFREARPNVRKIVAFGNCDAATALALFGADIDIDSFVLANPWVIEASDNSSGTPTTPPPSAIRSRYWERLKDPQWIIDLVTGKIDLRKLAKGLKQATRKQENTALSIRLKTGLTRLKKPSRILLAKRDTTALAFLAAWNSSAYSGARAASHITMESMDSASHSFADEKARKWLEDKILEALKTA